MSKSCLLCFVDNVLVTSDSSCLTAPARDYEITYGLMILSKKELKNQTVMPHNNQSQMRGILTASVRILGHQHACTLYWNIIAALRYIALLCAGYELRSTIQVHIIVPKWDHIHELVVTLWTR